MAILKKQSAWCTSRLARESKYEVKCFGGTQAMGSNWDHISYVHDYYKNEAFMKGYKPMVHPMASQNLWAKTNLPPSLPPKFHKQPGRPKKTRISSAGEPSPSSNPKAIHLSRSYQRLQKGPINTKLLLSLAKLLNHLTNQLNHLKLLLSLTKTPQPSHQAAQPTQASQFEQPSQESQFEQSSEASQFEQASQAVSLNKPLKLLSLNKPLKLLCLNKSPNLKHQIRLSIYKLPHKGKLSLSLQLSLSHGDIENLSYVFVVSWGTHVFLGKNSLFDI
ncbi:unnamed protein product [Prunus armeniaca]